jgi:hypothetical protein
MLYRKVAALAAGASASMLVFGSGIARADQSTYIQLLDAGGVPYDTPAGAMLMGQAVCSSLENGGSVDGIEQRIMVGGRSAGEADWTKAQAEWLMSAAVMDLCPQMQGVLKSYGPPFFISH